MRTLESSHGEYRGESIRSVLLGVFSICAFFPFGQTLAQIETDIPSLKHVFAKDFYTGCILSYRYIGFPSDPYVPGQSAIVDTNGGYLVKFHMNSMSPGNNMKPENTVDIAASAAAYASAATQAERDSIETHPIVRFNGDMVAQLDWARRQGFTFRGHVLVWHQQTPTAFFRSGYTSTGTRLTKAVMIERMDFYIREIIRLIHEGWPGMLSALDVVNEAVNDDTGTDRTDSEWYITFGDNSYIMKAFESARKYTVQFGEEQIKLYYNDYNEDNSNKANGIVRICGPVFRAGYLDGIGMQGHESLTYPAVSSWITSYDKFDTICTEMAFTEYFVSQGTSTPTITTLSRQANQYAAFFKCLLDRSYFSGRGKIINATQDGLNDRYDLFPDTHSSMWDSVGRAKPAFYAVANLGINYHTLDSLIAHADSLRESRYTAESWADLTGALSSARSAMARNYSAYVSATDTLGQAMNNLQTAIGGLVTGIAGRGEKPGSFRLDQNYPNPFNPLTTIVYHLAEPGRVDLSIYDVLGQKVRTLRSSFQNAGDHSVIWQATDEMNRYVASGIYFCRLETNEGVSLRKMVLVR